MEPITMTITIADNPLRGMPGQTDLTITVSGEPELDSLEKMLESPAFCAAAFAVRCVTGAAGETVIMPTQPRSDQ